MKPRKFVSPAVTLLACCSALSLSGPAGSHELEKLGNVNFPISCKISANAWPACGNQKLCSMAIARLNAC